MLSCDHSNDVAARDMWYEGIRNTT